MCCLAVKTMGYNNMAKRRSVNHANKIRKVAKVAQVMGEYKRGTLHSGSKTGPKVNSRKQAIAIALNSKGKY